MSISLSRAATADLGFPSEGLFAIRMPRRDGPASGGPDARALLDRQREMVRETVSRLAPLGGVLAVSGSSSWPLEPDGSDTETFSAESDPAKQSVSGAYQSIMQGYAGVLGVTVSEGAEPSAADLAQSLLTGTLQDGDRTIERRQDDDVATKTESAKA